MNISELVINLIAFTLILLFGTFLGAFALGGDLENAAVLPFIGFMCGWPAILLATAYTTWLQRKKK